MESWLVTVTLVEEGANGVGYAVEAHNNVGKQCDDEPQMHLIRQGLT